MTVGVVSMWHNHTELVEKFLELYQVDGWDRMILLDNGSTFECGKALEDAAHALQELTAKRVQVIHWPENDCTAAVNHSMWCLHAMGADVLCHVANDVVLCDKRWMQWLVNGVRKGLMQGPSLRSIHGVTYVDGTVLAIHRDDWMRLAGFSFEFVHPGHFGDTDLGWRASVLGIQRRACAVGTRDLEHYTVGDYPGLLERVWGRNEAVFLKRIRHPERVRERAADLEGGNE